ncbi:MAG: pyridoxamine 5'-phosphate oxidase [Bacteroidetes bacterium]|nr:MAG: pyridoxamine 5'-phosphate oxidase [Bacteroidota bacterium]
MPKVPFYTDPDPYKNNELDEHSADPDPFRQFSAWFRNAVDSGVSEPEAMFLATTGENGIPSGRIVLLKGFDPKGFVFFTNYNSRKGAEIAVNPFVAIVFHWKEIERQVRITGKVHTASEAESDEYFSSRPLESQISAMISSQSMVIPGRKTLEEKFDEMKQMITGHKLKRPANWGGFRVIPSTFEFWQARIHRLHDRIQYRLVKEKWIIERLAP